MDSSLDLQPPFKFSHKWFPKDGSCAAFGVLKLDNAPLAVNVFFSATSEIDAAIAELVALRAEMTVVVKCPAKMHYLPGVVYGCQLDAGHDGLHLDGKTQWGGEPAAVIDEPVEAGPHECLPEGWCCGAFRTRAAASTPEPPAVVAGGLIDPGSCGDVFETVDSDPLYCTLAAGHDGPHREITTTGLVLGAWLHQAVSA